MPTHASRKDPYNLKKRVQQHITSLIHTLTISFVLFIIYLSITNEFVFFTWHPILLSIGWMILMTEGILAFQSSNIFTKGSSHSSRVRLHWMLQAAATVLSVTGFTVVYLNKDFNNKSHFTSWHGLLGLISIICLLSTSLGGILALYDSELRKFFRTSIKFYHASCGILTYLLGTVTILLALYSNWFVRKTDRAPIGFGIILIILLWTLVKPVSTFFIRMKFILK